MIKPVCLSYCEIIKDFNYKGYYFEKGKLYLIYQDRYNTCLYDGNKKAHCFSHKEIKEFIKECIK